MRGEKTGLVIGILVLIIILLIGVVVYSLIAKPSFDNYVFEKQIEAQNLVITAILNQLQQTGHVIIPVGNESIVLVPSNLQQPTP